MRFLLCCFAIPSIVFSSNAQTTINGSFLHGGLQRDYILYIPAIYNAATATPVVFNLHGYTSDNLQQMFYADFRPIADTANFIIAAPNGTIDQAGNRAWNTFGATAVDDLGFITALLDTIGAHYNVDQERVYSTGMSNGGFMSYDLACFRSARFTAIASVTGTMITPRLTSCSASHPMPVMQIHGTADPTVPYAGGSGFVGIEPLVNYWVQFDHCNPTPTITPVPNISTSDGCTAEHRVYTGGDAGSTVEFFKVLGGGHTWPGSPFIVGITNQDFNACKEIWRFFSQYRLSQLTGIADRGTQEVELSIGPNPSTDVFEIRFTEPAHRTISLFDATGREVRTIRTRASIFELSVDAPGLFVVRVMEGEAVATRRLVKL